MKDFKKIKVWQKAHYLTLDIYKATQNFPKEEIYGLTSQMRRASSSIPANIAEGCGRSGDAELARFLRIATGSASELEYHILLAYDLKLLGNQSFSRLSDNVTEVKRMLSSFLKKLTAES
jgi:four helix bundle protein